MAQLDQVPDGGYGWFVVAALFCFNMGTWGSNSGFSVYLADYLNTGRFGMTKLDSAAIGGICFSAGMVFAPFINCLMGVIGARPTIFIGIVLQSAGILLAAFSTKLWQVYLTQGVLTGMGMGIICITVTTIPSQWFLKKRAMAMGIGTAGSAAGGILFNLAMEKIMHAKSVKWALIVQAILCCAINCIALLMTRTRVPPQKFTSVWELFPDNVALYNTGYWLCIAWCALTMFGYVIMLYSLADWTESLGYSPSRAALAPTFVNIGAFFGRPFVGLAGDRYGPVTVAITVSVLVALFDWAMWIPGHNLATALLYSLIQGSLMGSVWPLSPKIVGRIVSFAKLNVCYAFMWIWIGAFGAVAPVIGLKLRTSDYTHTAIFSGFGYFGGALCLFVLRGYLVARDDMEVDGRIDAHHEVHVHQDSDRKSDSLDERLECAVPVREVLHKMIKFRNLHKVV